MTSASRCSSSTSRRSPRHFPCSSGPAPTSALRVQWSLHTLHADGTLDHAEWLCENPTENPDSEFMRTLLEALRPTGTFIHYSPYERTQMVDIAVRNPEFRQPLVDLLPGFRESLTSKLAENGASFADLRPSPNDGLADFDLGLRIVSRGCVHPTLGPGRYTIKTATKLLARDLPPYEGLAVSDGDQAMAATQEMLDPATDPDASGPDPRGAADVLRPRHACDGRDLSHAHADARGLASSQPPDEAWWLISPAPVPRPPCDRAHTHRVLP